MWQHACLVLVSAAVASSFYTQYAFPQVMYSQPRLNADQDQKYDCPREGFFINPRNCSQFYRCVDYTGTGYVYSVYAFECPRFHVFILDGDNSTCVPGTECYPGSQTDSHVPSATTQRPSGTTSGSAGIDFPISSGGGGGGGDGSSGGGLRPLPVRPTTPRPIQSTSGPVTSRPVIPANPIQATPGPPVLDCRGQYVQHEMFCNVYYKCSFEADKFLCPSGSVFDTVRQMCRIQAADEDLCGGKSIYSVSFRYDSSVPFGNIGFRTHLPESISSFSSPQKYRIPQSQPNYLAYFNPTHPLRINTHLNPLQYIQPITTQFTQGHSGGHSYRVAGSIVDNFSMLDPETIISHPEPVHPRQYHRVADGDRTIFSLPVPQPENVHPRQYHPVNDEASQSQSEVEIANPRQYYRIIDEATQSQAEPEIVNPRQYYRITDEARQPQLNLDPPQYYRMVDENTQYQLTPEAIHPRQYHRPIDSELNIDSSEYY